MLRSVNDNCLLVPVKTGCCASHRPQLYAGFSKRPAAFRFAQTTLEKNAVGGPHNPVPGAHIQHRVGLRRLSSGVTVVSYSSLFLIFIEFDRSGNCERWLLHGPVQIAEDLSPRRCLRVARRLEWQVNMGSSMQNMGPSSMRNHLGMQNSN